MSLARRFTTIGGLSGVLATAVVALAAVAITAGAAAPAARADVRRCDSSTKNWVALYPTWEDWLVGRNASYCIGFRGTWDVPTNNTQVFCAGNNRGTVTFYDRNTEEVYTKSFSPDRSYSNTSGFWRGASPAADSLDILSVTITGWSGSAGC